MDQSELEANIGDRHMELAKIAVDVYRTLESTEQLFSKQELLTALLNQLMPEMEIQSEDKLAPNKKTQHYRAIQEDYYRGLAQFLTIFWMYERGYWNHEQTEKVFEDIASLLKSEHVSIRFIHWYY